MSDRERLEPRLRRLARRKVGPAGHHAARSTCINVQGVDEKGGWLYYIASPDNPAQRYLFRTRLNGKGKPERLTPAREPGTHAYDVAPNYRYAFQTYSSFGNPPSHPPGRAARRTESSGRWWTTSALRGRVAALRRGPVEFFTLDRGRRHQAARRTS